MAGPAVAPLAPGSLCPSAALRMILANTNCLKDQGPPCPGTPVHVIELEHMPTHVIHKIASLLTYRLLPGLHSAGPVAAQTERHHLRTGRAACALKGATLKGRSTRAQSTVQSSVWRAVHSAPSAPHSP